ncbi:PfkB family carbohydrate kinase [Saccharopolyspora sp. K220]|uniref:carbohydrate kinase family protein n=1 Tax=Saccharopolyspora soli TaxID=2926618 RepID=UPI001F5843EC|nr:PfkB family carbohydrate kinase [Saccharopolyspora soli]MCI2421662.1 PfkB family carbohydrate kinase [Saccharopolyspora soli]
MIAFCGYANSDLTIGVPALPTAGNRVQATTIDRGDGGMAANAAVAAARMGADARFAGVVGNDPLSDAFLAALVADGVDVAWTARTGGLTTSVILVTPDGERSIISQDDAITAEHLVAVATRTAACENSWLYLDGYRFPWAASMVRGVRTIVDLDGCTRAEGARAALDVADHVIAGRALAGELLGDDSALARAAVRTATHLVVTDGARGWQMYAPDGAWHEGAALPVSAVDATGAGDCFVGVYAAELERGVAPAEAARFAAVAAGLSCTEPGARAGLPSRDAVTNHRTAPANPNPAARST